MGKIYVVVLLICLTSVAVSAGRGDSDYEDDDDYGSYGEGDYVDQSSEPFLRKFMSHYCKGVRGHYRKCQTCVAIGCLREIDSPRQKGRYDDCLNKYNRCCGREGVHAENVMTGVTCYATGTYDSFVIGELNVAKAIIGDKKISGTS